MIFRITVTLLTLILTPVIQAEELQVRFAGPTGKFLKLRITHRHLLVHSKSRKVQIPIDSCTRRGLYDRLNRYVQKYSQSEGRCPANQATSFSYRNSSGLEAKNKICHKVKIPNVKRILEGIKPCSVNF